MSKARKEILNSKSGNVVLLIFAVIMCVFFPVMAVIYDIGQMRMYQQDVKNAQEIAGLACVGVSGGSAGISDSPFLGGFNGKNCQKIALATAWANLGQTAQMDPPYGTDTEYLMNVIKNQKKRLVACEGQTPTVNVEPANKGHNFTVQIVGLCYRPMFINSKLLNFKVLENSPYQANIKFKDEYKIEVRPSWFSAVYNKAG